MRTECLYGDRLVPCFKQRPSNLDHMLRQVVMRWPNQEALVYEDTRLSYLAFDAQVSRLAVGMQQAGIKAGQRVAIFLGNCCEFVVSVFAVLRLGAICVPIGIRQSGHELLYMLNQCGASALVYDLALRDRLPEIGTAPELKHLWCVGEQSYLALANFDAGELRDSVIDEQSAAFIMYTSGTTGQPKGAVLSHLGFFHTAKNYELTLGYNQHTRMVLAVPGSHISGLLAVLMVMVQVGGCTVLMREFKALALLRLIESEHITATLLVPAMYNLCLLEPRFSEFDLRSWTLGHFGGAPMPSMAIEGLARYVPSLHLHNGYGATETTSAVTLSSAKDTLAYPDSVGRVLPGVDIQVLDEQGCEVLPGNSGELFVRSPGNAIGYWNDPLATRREFVGGYWRSGDIGSLGADGFLRLLDRRKDMINRGGYKVYSSEVENVLLRLEGVIEAAVVPVPCPVLGERSHAFIYAQAGLSLAELRQFAALYLADYKLPDFLSVQDSPLPRNLNGKLVKLTLRDLALQQAQSRLT